MTYVRPRRRITRQSRWRDLSDFSELRIFMAGRLLVSRIKVVGLVPKNRRLT
jgi:hypothetical protein